MDIATNSNVRTTQAAKEGGIGIALRVAFTGGAGMGFIVVSLGLMGISLFFFLMSLNREITNQLGVDAKDEAFIWAADSLAGEYDGSHPN